MTDPSFLNTGDNQTDFPVVAMGASAGGLKPLEAFFRTLPADTGMAFVVIVHLLPGSNSLLPKLIERQTQVPVHTINDDVVIQPNTIYVLAPGQEVSLWDGQFQLSNMTDNPGWSRIIDRVLQSLARDRGQRAGAVIFSGAGKDGTEGVRAIKANGGLVIAQKPTSASHPGMPQHVIDAELADVVLLPEQMPLYALMHFFKEKRPEFAQDEQNTLNEKELDRVVLRLRRQTGRDFADYKMHILRRQVVNRMRLADIDTIDAYLDVMEQQPEEAQKLAQFLLIHVTQFFRDPEAFEALKQDALLPLLQSIDDDEVFRAWVPGCASGEEAVSIAILIYECLQELDKTQMDVRIFASDVHRDMIDRARSGVYPLSIADDISEERLQAHFVQEEHSYRVCKHISRMLLWSVHNVVDDPPFSRLNLISCRNVLIYFQQRLQDHVTSLFQYALNPGGILFLGSSESTPETWKTIMPVNSRYRIYRQEARPKTFWLRLDHSLAINIPEKQEPEKIPDGEWDVPLTTRVKEAFFAHHRPTCVIVDEAYHAIYADGDIDRYLRLIPGEPAGRRVTELARTGLRADLNLALHDSFETGETITRHDIHVQTNHDPQKINLIVRPLEDRTGKMRLRLIIFEEAPASEQPEDTDDAPPADEDASTFERLQAKLAKTQQTLEAKKQSLRAAREEVRSIDEESRITYAELMSSQQELQTVNEELQTLNDQLIIRHEELRKANDTLYNFMQATRIGMVFVDQNLHIREYTSALTDLFYLRPHDKGRSLTDIANRLRYRLIDDANHVLNTLEHVEKEIERDDGRWYLMRIRPYRTVDNIINGLVITFSEITAQKEAREALHRSEARLHAFIEASFDVVYRMSPDWKEMRYLKGNRFSPDTDSPDDTWLERYIHPDDRAEVSRVIQQAIRNKQACKLEHRILREDGSFGWTHSRAVPILDDSGEIVEWFGTATNISEHKKGDTDHDT